MMTAIINARARLLTPPYGLPLNIEDAKRWCDIPDDADDEQVKRLIRGAVDEAESITYRQLVVAQIKLYLDEFPEWEIYLPRSPVLSIDSVKYKPTNYVSTLTTIAATEYVLDSVSEPGRLTPAYGEEWPSTYDEVNAVEITYKGGYLTPFTVSGNTLTLKGRTYTTADVIRLSNSGGQLPGGLSTETDYYVLTPGGSSFTISTTSGGSAVALTGIGTGTHYIGTMPETIRDMMLLLIAARYEYPEGGDDYEKARRAATYGLRGEWTGEFYPQ